MLSALYVLVVFLLVFLNGFFVAAEFALVGVRRSRVETLAAAGDRRAARLLLLLDRLNAYISATQLGITMASLALERAERVALAVSWPMQAFYKIFRWPIRLLDWAGTRAVRLLGLRPSQGHASVYTEEELRHLVDASRRSGHLEEEERRLIHRVFEFSDAEVREAMVPRTAVSAIPSTATLEEAKAAF